MHTLLKPLLLASTALAAVHTIDVGEKGLTFDPQTVTAAKGDIVIFKFYPTHDVAQADFNAPCKPASNAFYSGPFSGTDNGKKKFVYTVNSTDPVFFYCTVENHCREGMVGAINAPNDGDNIKKFADAAKGVQGAEAPKGVSGGQLEGDDKVASLTASGASGSATASASGSGAPSGSAASTTQGGTASAASSGASSKASSTSSPTGAANVVAAGPASGVLAAVFGFAAWLL